MSPRASLFGQLTSIHTCKTDINARGKRLVSDYQVLGNFYHFLYVNF